MSDSVYRVTEVIGVSADSWEAAAQNAVQTAARTIRDLRVAEATRFDVTIEDGKIASYRVRLDLSFQVRVGRLGGPAMGSGRGQCSGSLRPRLVVLPTKGIAWQRGFGFSSSSSLCCSSLGISVEGASLDSGRTASPE